MLRTHFFCDAIRAQRLNAAFHEDLGFVQRVAEGIASVTADHQTTSLPHEAAHVSNTTADHNVDALHRNAAACTGVTFNHQQTAMGSGASGLRSAAFHSNVAGHHVLCTADTNVTVHGD
ncbi:hypothetical protein D3C81_1506850 [compost metagenome]